MARPRLLAGDVVVKVATRSNAHDDALVLADRPEDGFRHLANILGMVSYSRFTDFPAPFQPDEDRAAFVRKTEKRPDAIPRSTDLVRDTSGIADRQTWDDRYWDFASISYEP